ncbi:MAG: SMP-30/gluconolactonase/LRE family protein [Lutibacter sp.]|nr:SMP-30/gluconolactonase/LRE family protein [Lutibacter sp.]
MSIDNKAELIFYNGSSLLEGPVFDDKNNLLYFVSIYQELIFCLNLNTKEILSIKTSGPVGCVCIKGYKRLISAEKNGVYLVDFSDFSRKLICQLNQDNDFRYNDGILDKTGRFIVGTMGDPTIIQNQGVVYSYYNNNKKILITGTTISNGMGFSPDSKYFYFIDTPTKKVARYFYSLETGDIEFDKFIIEFKGEGFPDGMFVDDDGYLWIAEWGGGKVSKWDPQSGVNLQNINLPCVNVSSCCLVDSRNLYVTTAKEESLYEPFAGGLFHVSF